MARQRRARNGAGELLEDPFRQQVEQLASFYGWLSYHTHDSRRSAPGFPDNVMVRGPELLFVEFKTDKGRIRPEQQAWLEALASVGSAVDQVRPRPAPGEQWPLGPCVEAHVWRPRDFDEIHARLARGVHQHPLIDSPTLPPPAAPTQQEAP